MDDKKKIKYLKQLAHIRKLPPKINLPKGMTNSQVRSLLKDAVDLEQGYDWLVSRDMLSTEFVRVISREQCRRKGKLKSCEKCGGKEDLTIHHRIPLFREISKETVLDIKNLTVLCKECHTGGV